MRVWAVSDLHVDFRENLQWVENVSQFDFRDDVLLIAGDVSHHLELVEAVFDALNEKFLHLFFVPGNHDLWVRDPETSDSIAKFHQLMDLCRSCDVITQSRLMDDVWVVPLMSWYRFPEHGADSLFVEKHGEDPSLRMWSDNVLTKWSIDAGDVVDYFLNLNTPHLLEVPEDGPVISFSHFLPRQELIFSTVVEHQQVRPGARDPHPGFNFSRVAGSSLLDDQIRALGSLVHVYGHQHRNRNRLIDGVQYVSHCVGYRRERSRNLVCDLDGGPMQVWPDVF